MKTAFITQPWDGIGNGSSVGILTESYINYSPDECEFIIFAKNGKCNLDNREAEKRVNYVYLSLKADKIIEKFLKFFYSVFKKNKHTPYYFSVFYYFFYSLKIAVSLRKHRPDIVHIHNYSQFVIPIKLFNPGIKTVLHMHCEWLSQLDRTILNKRLSKFDLILGCSNYITEKAAKALPEHKYKIRTLYNGCSLNKIESGYSSDEKFHILFTGRVSPEKGVHILMKSFVRLKAKYPELFLDIAGPVKSAPYSFIAAFDENNYFAELSQKDFNDYGNFLKKLIPVEMESSVKFHGFTSGRDLSSLYKNCALLVNPSLSEAFGMSVIEAQSWGKPVVVSSTGGMNELVTDGINGLKSVPSDADSLSAKIEMLIQNPNIRREIGENGFVTVSAKFSMETITEKLFNYYSELL